MTVGGKFIPKKNIVGCFSFNSHNELFARIEAINAVSEIDIIEIRLDYLHPQQISKKLLKYIKNCSKKPLILTIRDYKEGGVHNYTDILRRELFQTALELNFDFIDIEWSNLQKFDNILNNAKFTQEALHASSSKIIVSYHALLPENLAIFRQKLDELLKIEGIYPKIVFSVRSGSLREEKEPKEKEIEEREREEYEEIERFEQFQLEILSSHSAVPITIFATGPHSHFSRIAGAYLGNTLNYVAFDKGCTTAPNQISLKSFLQGMEIFQSMILGNSFSVAGFGTSHGYKIGCIIKGIKRGIRLDFSLIRTMLQLRRPGFNEIVSSRKELDNFIITNGIQNGFTDGKPVRMIIKNQDVNSRDYQLFKKIPRPSHVDYPAKLRFGENINLKGSGFFSGRLSAAYVMGGAVALQMLSAQDIHIIAYITKIGKIKDDNEYNPKELIKFHDKRVDILTHPEENSKSNNDGYNISKYLCYIGNPDLNIAEKMLSEVRKVQQEGDSIGGIIKVIVLNFPKGIGDPWFQSLESQLVQAIFGIPGVRGVEFGTGFAAAEMHGSEHNDPFVCENGEIETITNHSGGIVGGITTGMPISFSIAIKPTASIKKAQKTLNFQNKQMEILEIPGRHDPCIVPRILPVVESISAIVLLNALNKRNN
ncbi:MAG: chorismate synthase [Promethearchaeota archaeon]